MESNPFEVLNAKLDVLIELIGKANRPDKNSEEKKPIRGINGLATFLNCSMATAQKLKNSGKIPYSQYGRVVMFDPERIMDALEK